MQKDYQEEVEEIINRLTVEFDTNNLWKSDDGDTAYVAIGNLWDSIRKEMTETLTTYSNARVEEIIKIAKGMKGGVEDIKIPSPPYNTLSDKVCFKNGHNQALTDLIENIKK